MKLLFASILLLLTFNVSSAQSTYFDYNSKDLTAFLKMRVRPMPLLMENCLMPFTYVKFKVTKENAIDSLVITNNTLRNQKDELLRVMTLTNGHWNTEEIKDKWLILPLFFHTEYNNNKRGKGCDFKKIVIDQYNEMNYVNTETNAIYLPVVTILAVWNN